VLHFCARSEGEAPLLAEVESLCTNGELVRWFRAPDAPGRFEPAALGTLERGTHLYACGPQTLVATVRYTVYSAPWVVMHGETTPRLEKPFVPEPFSAAAGTALGDELYVIGGNGDPKDKSIDGRQVFAFDVAHNRWTRKASLPKPRTNLAAVALGGKIYALGGLDPNHATSSVYIYDPKTNTWSIGPSLPEKLHALAAVAFQGGIWVIGGQDAAGRATNHVWIYSPHAHAWRKGTRMPYRLETAGASVADDEIHVVLENKYLIYDPGTRKWRKGPSLETPRHALAVYAINGELYAMGGCATPQLEDSSVVEKLPL
jgi:N-acetylneuraminic acid mutarotase